MQTISRLTEARGRWGGAEVVQGGRDTAFLRTHRAGILARLIELGLTPAEASEAFRRGLAAATAPRSRAGEPPRAA